MALHEMNPVDAAWYHLDSPANPAVVNALVSTRKPLDFERVKALFEQRLLRFDRFRQRVVEPTLGLGLPQWEDAADFEIERHLHHLAVPAPGDDAALRALLGELVSAPLPQGQPLWQAYVIAGTAGGGALVLRYHHCIGDGLAMMTVAAALFDSASQPQRLAPSAVEPPAAPTGGLLVNAFEALLHPGQLAEAATQLAAGARVLLGELLRPGDPASPFKGDFGPRQRVAWSAPVPLAELKAIGRPFGAKLNDVLVAALAGALGAYLTRRGLDPGRASLRAMVPVNLRPPERSAALGNEFGLVILELPVGEPDPQRRLAQAKARMDALKRSPEAPAMQWLFRLFGHTPKAVEDLAQSIFGSKASLVLSNVAGPQRRLYLAGVAVDRLMFWVPHPGDELGLGLSLISYHGQAWLGVITDARLVPDPESIAAAFNAGLAQLGMLRTAAAGLSATPPGRRRSAAPARSGRRG